MLHELQTKYESELALRVKEETDRILAGVSKDGAQTRQRHILRSKSCCVAQDRSLSSLRPVGISCQRHAECLPGTRFEVLREIEIWLQDPHSTLKALWIHGGAGSGKSTIMATIARHYHRQCGALLHFDRDDRVESAPEAVVPTLAYQLAQFHPLMRVTICEQLDANPDVLQTPLHRQFDVLLLEPLRRLNLALLPSSPIIILLDALDECGDRDSQIKFLDTLSTVLTNFPGGFRVLLTSRHQPHPDFCRSAHVKTMELGLASAEDIDAYFKSSIHETIGTRADRLPLGWPGDSRRQRLVQLAGGLFIWATRAVDFINSEGHPDDHLTAIFSPSASRRLRLGSFYATALREAIDWGVQGEAADARALLGAVVAVTTLMSDVPPEQYFPSTFNSRNELSDAFHRLRCLLQWEPGHPVRIIHQSLVDYLQDITQCEDHPWFIDPQSNHHNTAIACFGVMDRQLHFNICQIPSSHLANSDVEGLDATINNQISPTLQYACLHWAGHLHSASRTPDLWRCLERFLDAGFLYWLEVLSFLKSIPSARAALNQTLQWVQVSIEQSSR